MDINKGLIVASLLIILCGVLAMCSIPKSHALVITSGPTSTASKSSSSAKVSSSSLGSSRGTVPLPSSVSNSSIPASSSIPNSSQVSSAASSIWLVQPVVTWKRPIERTNLVELPLSELGGFKLSFKPSILPSNAAYTDEIDISPNATLYKFPPVPCQNYDVKLLAYDTKGLYSDAYYVTYPDTRCSQPVPSDTPPKPVSEVKFL